MALPLLLACLLLLSMEAARRRGDFPFFPPSGFSIHQELFPVPSFCMRTKRLCRERLCLIEFWIEKEWIICMLSVYIIILITYFIDSLGEIVRKLQKKVHDSVVSCARTSHLDMWPTRCIRLLLGCPTTHYVIEILYK